jgi:hypothetical protein
VVVPHVLGALVDLRDVWVHPAGRDEVLRLAIPEVRFGRVQCVPVRGHLGTARIHGRELTHGNVGARVYQQLLDHDLRTLVVGLAETMVPDAPLGVDEVQGRPVMVREGLPDA